MKTDRNISVGVPVALLAAALLFLVLVQFVHFEFFLHLAAIPLEVLLAVFIIERILERRAARSKRRQLMFIKSTMFRSEMRNLFLANFEALKTPRLTMSSIRRASLEELRLMRREAEKVEYKSLPAMEPVIMEYVRARGVWLAFMERAITFDFEEIFNDMIFILHFISDVAAFKENNPKKLFILEARSKKPVLDKARRILGDGIQRFLDYAIELKEKRPDLFEEMMEDYEASALLRRA
ncbi:MAG: hypothetical protein JW747_09975 [Candidatus Aminicenantes bacterium]|nr:hypothetical protein [Candidatus Aminicenantes bacterium]